MSLNILIMGVQGAGKGTQGKRLAEHFHLTHISTGDMFREEYYIKQSEFGKQAYSHWGTGGLVPDDLTIMMIQQRLEYAQGCVLDGFPRTIGQAQALDAAKFPIYHVIDLQLHDDVAITRLSHRRLCSCGQEYGLARVPKTAGFCDACNTPLKIREDDAPEKIAKRVADYHTKTQPILDFYRPRGIVYEVNAHQEPNNVFSDIVNHWQKGTTRRYASESQ